MRSGKEGTVVGESGGEAFFCSVSFFLLESEEGEERGRRGRGRRRRDNWHFDK